MYPPSISKSKPLQIFHDHSWVDSENDICSTSVEESAAHNVNSLNAVD